MNEEPIQRRLSRRKLEHMAEASSARDLAVLITLGDCRFATTSQLTRLHFTENANPAAATRAANRALAKLQEDKLISSLTRRVGGVRGGSGDFVWSLTSGGSRLLNLDTGEGDEPRRRRFDPSPRFVEHTLAVTELFVQLSAISGVALTTAHFEPLCWRGSLKPDMFAVTSDGEYEDHWFFEIDLNTEAPCRILQKCEQYEEYYRSGAEQVFPLVVWIVPDAKRQASIREQIAQSKTLKHKNIFMIITPDELEGRVRKGAVI
ncbi:MAG: replication-relaxation family protein [Oscillospiraceae bacterium]|jgi:hypothetical protein|nr:replication-relaxation family protein [Oscillospiraceae bacterium]